MLLAQPPTLSTGCLRLFLVVFHFLKFYLVSLLIMRISIHLAVEFTNVYVITHLTNFLPVAYRVFFLVIVPHIKASVVLTLQPLAHILHDMLGLMRFFSRFQILPILLLFMLLVFQIFTSLAPLNHLIAHHLLLLLRSLLSLLVISVQMTLLLSPCRFLLLLSSPRLLQLQSCSPLYLLRTWLLLQFPWTRFMPLLHRLLLALIP